MKMFALTTQGGIMSTFEVEFEGWVEAENSTELVRNLIFDGKVEEDEEDEAELVDYIKEWTGERETGFIFSDEEGNNVWAATTEEEARELYELDYGQFMDIDDEDDDFDEEEEDEDE